MTKRERVLVWETLAHRLRLDRWFYLAWRLNPRSLFHRYQQYRFDSEHNVETSGYDDLRYEPTPTVIFDRLMEAADIEFDRVSFIDIGSGKGKVLLLAARYPFRRVIGVEKFEDLYRTGEANLERAREPMRCGGVETHCLDARFYEFPDEPSVVYFFNPFPLEILREVLKNLEQSLRLAPRPLTVLFYAPILRRGTPWDRRRIFDASPMLKIEKETREFTIYQSRRP